MEYYILITSDKQSTKQLDNLMKILIVKIYDYMFCIIYYIINIISKFCKCTIKRISMF